MTTKTEDGLTWTDLVGAEPRLGKLLERVRSIKREIWATREDGEIRLDFYRSVREYLDWIRPGVECIVGWDRRRGPKFLQTSDAYATAINTLWEALPHDFDEDEIHDARERAYEAELDEGEWMLMAGPVAV